MVDNQLTPLNLYFHTNKQEWRARYCELDLKKTKHFSCNRYGHNRSYFLATLYLTSIKLYQLPLTADDILSWFSIIKDFKSLDDTPQKVIPKSLTHNKPLDNKLLDNKLPHNKLPDNKLLDNKLLEKLMLDVRSKSMFECAVESVASREYVMGVTFPVPELCKQSICNEFNNLVSLLKCYKVEGDRGKPKPEPQTHNEQLTLQDLFSHVMNISHNPIYPFNTHTVDSMENTVDIVDTVDSVDTVEVGVENTVDSAATIDNTVDNSLDTIESTVDNSLDTVEDVAGAVGPNAVTEDISKLIQMNNKKYNKVYKLLNHFILKLRDSTEEFGPTCDNIPQDYEHIAAVDVDEEEISGLLKICKSNEEVIEEMSRGFRGNARYRNNTETFINTFNHLFKQDTFHNTQSYSNSVGSGDSVGGVESVSDDDVNSLQQYFRHNSLYNLTSFREDEECVLDKGVDLSKICNERLNSLLRQTEHLEPEELLSTLSVCFEQESKSSSDLASLIRICTITPQNTGETLYKSNRLYQVNGTYNGQYIDVVYKYGKIIPKSTLKFYSNPEHPIVLRGNEKMDVNMEMIERIFSKNFNQSDNVQLILQNLRLIDSKLTRVVKEYENMHMAIYKYVNTADRDLKCKNYVEELVNLETLHVIAETLMQTKLKLITQVYNYYNTQVNLLESVIPRKYFQIFKEIFYHQYEQF